MHTYLASDGLAPNQQPSTRVHPATTNLCRTIGILIAPSQKGMSWGCDVSYETFVTSEIRGLLITFKGYVRKSLTWSKKWTSYLLFSMAGSSECHWKAGVDYIR